MKKAPKGLNKEEQFQLGIFRLMKDISDVESQLSSNKGLRQFVKCNSEKVKKISYYLGEAHNNIQEAAKQFSHQKPKERQISFSLDIENV